MSGTGKGSAIPGPEEMAVLGDPCTHMKGCIFRRNPTSDMVLEEFLVFYRDEDADTFIRFLKSKGCHATKMHRDTDSESFGIKGGIGDMIAMLEEIALEEKSISAEPPLDIDSLASHLSDPRVSSGEQPLNSPLVKSSINAYNLKLLKEKRDFVVDIMARYAVGDLIATAQEIESLSALVASAMRNDPDEDFTVESRQALILFGKFTWMRENGLVTISRSGVTLVKKTDPETIHALQIVPVPHMYDDGLLEKHSVCLFRSIFLKIYTTVALDPQVHFTCSPEEIGDALIGLAVDEKSMEQLFINMFFKQYLIGRVKMIVKNAKTISLEGVLQAMRNELIENDWRDYPTEISASPDYVAGLVTRMRKAKIITGSNEKMRLA